MIIWLILSCFEPELTLTHLNMDSRRHLKVCWVIQNQDGSSRSLRQVVYVRIVYVWLDPKITSRQLLYHATFPSMLKQITQKFTWTFMWCKMYFFQPHHLLPLVHDPALMLALHVCFSSQNGCPTWPYATICIAQMPACQTQSVWSRLC